MAPKTIVGRYAVERAVGEGGMGTVWLCRDEVLKRHVAVKEIGSLPGTSKSDLARALREARNSAALNHRNVVSIYDAVEDGDKNWLVMEYVPSRTLSELVAEEGPLPPERVVWFGAQAADGLAAAHERGTMHRDVKPGNLLVTDDDQVKISDFGLARTHGDTRITQSGMVTGTPAFFAPELAKGSEPTTAADVWALGATLYAAVEGRLPYPDKGNAIAMLTEIAAGPPPPPSRAGFLAEPIRRMMDPDPGTRWTMADAAHALHRLHRQHAVQDVGPGTVSFPLATADDHVEDEPTTNATDESPAAPADHEPTAAAADAVLGGAGADAGVAETLDQGLDTEADEGQVTEANEVPETEADEGPDTEATSAPEPSPAPEPSGGAAAPPAGPDSPVDHPPADRRRPVGRRLAAAAVVLLAIVGVGAWLAGDRDPDPSATDKPTTSAPSDSGGSEAPDSQGSDAPSDEAPTTGGETGGGSTATSFVEDYYSRLPSDTKSAWDLLSPSMQDEVGGYGDYVGFWRTISSVRVVRTTSVGDGVVDVQLTYTSDRGTESETRRLHLVKSGDSFRISGDEVV